MSNPELIPLKNEPPARNTPRDWPIADTNTIIEVTIVVRSATTNTNTPDSWDNFFTCDPDELQALADHYTALGMSVVSFDPNIATLTLSGTAEQLSAAFAVNIQQSPDGKQFIYAGRASAPATLVPYIEHLLGLNSTTFKPLGTGPIVRQKDPYTIHGLTQRYHYPLGNGGKGEKVAIIVMDGGFLRDDAEAFWKSIGLETFPTVTFHGKDNPCPRDRLRTWLKYWDLLSSDPTPAAPTHMKTQDRSVADDLLAHWTYETTMDTEVIAAMSPQADYHIFNIGDKPATMIPKLIAFMKKVRPTVIVGSFGYDEQDDNLQMSFETVLSVFALLGGTAVFSSGNYGSNYQGPELKVTFPASSPHALAVGGETIESATSEQHFSRVWNSIFADKTHLATSGGVSKSFNQDLPWQAEAKAAYAQSSGMTLPSGRILPDMSLVSDIHLGPLIRITDWIVMSGGTSLAAQLATALMARIRNYLTENGVSCANLNQRLYDPAARSAFSGVTYAGNNWIPTPEYPTGPYDCKPGELWNPCVGLGFPNGHMLAEVLLTGPKPEE